MEYALVTASTAGIGYAIARRLLAEGHFCFLNYAHDDRRAQELRRGLASVRDRFRIVKADLSRIEGADVLIRRVQEEGVKLSHLVLNCGATDRTPFGGITPEAWNRVFDANLTVPFFLLQGLYDSIMKAGSVVMISSLMGRVPHASSISYGVSKAAVSALCRNLVKATADKQIRVNALEPGFVDTPWQKDKPQEQRRRIESKIALGRFAAPEEVADFCYSMLHNTYINGACVPLCGGYDMA